MPYPFPTLPGGRHSTTDSAVQLQSLIAALVLAYNGLANPRRLEASLYAFWGKWFDLMVYDLAPEVLSCPQYPLYLGNQEIDGDTSINTVTGSGGIEIIPDFVHVAVILACRHPPPFPLVFPPLAAWDYLTVSRLGLLTIGEIKRFPSRHILDDNEFACELVENMEEAQGQACKQAIIGFYDVRFIAEEVVLVAAAGEWWTFRFIKRVEYAELLDALKEEEYDGQVDKLVKEEIGKIKTQRAQIPKKPSGVRKTAKTTKRHKLETMEFVESPNSTLKQTLPESGYWSGYLRIGTLASNRAQFIVHSKIQSLKEAVATGEASDFESTLDTLDADPGLINIDTASSELDNNVYAGDPDDGDDDGYATDVEYGPVGDKESEDPLDFWGQFPRKRKRTE
ncbi:hypothetical protein CPC08DRAFT_770036 [Agrocybe pediades]|nr:hypothetical protein CPC08DRAFT_770036 [Agrocybe pediades]